MLYYSSTPKEINLWWDSRIDYKKGYRYQLELDDMLVGKTSKIFYDFMKLHPNTEYKITLYLIDRNGNVKGDKETIYAKTKPLPKTIDITKEPYLANCMGEKDNTSIIYKAISENETGTIIYFPQGVYLVKNLIIDTDCILSFEKGAIIREMQTKND